MRARGYSHTSPATSCGTRYTHAEWAFRGGDGQWAAKGRLVWPWGGEYDKPQPIRVCYPNVAIRGRQVHFCGVSDIGEPYSKWRDYKRKLTGREWDYDFRRLFYTWTDDINRPAPAASRWRARTVRPRPRRGR